MRIVLRCFDYNGRAHEDEIWVEHLNEIRIDNIEPLKPHLQSLEGDVQNE